MTEQTVYQLKAGEYVKDSKLYGWTGRKCFACHGTGESDAEDFDRTCTKCAGTGDEHGLMPVQPVSLPPDTE